MERYADKIGKYLFICLFFFTHFFQAQSEIYFKIDSIPAYNPAISRSYGLQLPKIWKYCKGDNPKWALNNFDDKNWPHIETIINMENLPKGAFEGIGWFRLHVKIDSIFNERVMGLMIDQYGASEIYIDGIKVHELGKISLTDLNKQERYNPKGVPLHIIFKSGRNHLIAVRYANALAVKNLEEDVSTFAGFRARIGEMRESVFNSFVGGITTTSFFIFYFTFLAVSFLHLMLYLFNKSNRSHLFYSIFSGGFGLYFLFVSVGSVYFYPDFTTSLQNKFVYLPSIYLPAILAMLYCIFYNNRLPKIFWIWFTFFLIDLVLTIFNVSIPGSGIIMNAIIIIEPIRIIIVAIYKKKDGAWIIGTGIISTIIFFILFFTIPFFTQGGYSNPTRAVFVAILIVYFTLNIPLSMSIFLARDFAIINKKLQLKLREVEELSKKNIEQEKEKQRMLENQNLILEEKVIERTIEISTQKKVIEEKNKDITDSIKYARRIQMALLPNESMIKRLLAKFNK